MDQYLNNRLVQIERRQDVHEEHDTSRFNSIGAVLTDIKENHLAHIQADMYWIKWLVMGEIAGFGLILVGVMVAVLTKA